MSNRSGFAAIASSVECTDPHAFVVSPSPSCFPEYKISTKKRPLSQSDTLTYMFLKSIVRQSSTGVYILFLSSFVSETLGKKIASTSKLSSTVIVVQRIENEYIVTMDLGEAASVMSFYDHEELSSVATLEKYIIQLP